MENWVAGPKVAIRLLVKVSGLEGVSWRGDDSLSGPQPDQVGLSGLHRRLGCRRRITRVSEVRDRYSTLSARSLWIKVLMIY